MIGWDISCYQQMTSKPKGTVKRAAKTCNFFCNIAAKRMLRVLAPTFKPLLQHIKVAASCVNTDFWLDKITREFSLYTGVTSLAAKQVCHVATRSTVPLCHLWPVAPGPGLVSPVAPRVPYVPCGFCGPCRPCGPFVLCCPFAALSLGGPCVPLCPLWPLWPLCSLCPLWSLCLLCPLWPLWPLFLWNERRSRSQRKRDISFPNDHQTTRNQKRALRNSILTVARP